MAFLQKQKQNALIYNVAPPPFPRGDNSSRRGRPTMYRSATAGLQMFIMEDERFILN